eukprot:1484165-Amphidinium_carterae.1
MAQSPMVNGWDSAAGIQGPLYSLPSQITKHFLRRRPSFERASNVKPTSQKCTDALSVADADKGVEQIILSNIARRRS